MDKYIEVLHTDQVLANSTDCAFFTLSFPAQASIERIVVAETMATTLTASGLSFTVDVFNSKVAENKDPKVRSLYKVVPSQAGNNSAIELVIQSGGMFHNRDGTDASPISKIYVEVTLSGAASSECKFDVAIGAVIPN